jgi:hypothetical protein
LMVGVMTILRSSIFLILILAVLVFFGIRVFVGRRKRQIQREVGEGVCVGCGAKIIGKKCPNCDSTL